MDTPKPMPGIWQLRRPDGRYYMGESPIACLRMEQAERVPAQVAVQRVVAALAYPHHCAPDDVAALVQRLEALSDPEQEAAPSYENTDWRTLAGVAARVIKYLGGDDWRHGA
jgi:hypothetical protein